MGAVLTASVAMMVQMARDSGGVLIKLSACTRCGKLAYEALCTFKVSYVISSIVLQVLTVLFI